MPGKEWTAAEKQRAVKLHQDGQCVETIAVMLGRNRAGVYHQLHRCGISIGKKRAVAHTIICQATGCTNEFTSRTTGSRVYCYTCHPIVLRHDDPFRQSIAALWAEGH